MAALEAEHYLQEIGSQEGKTDWWVPVRVQPNGWKLGMSCRSRHPRFIATRGVSLDHLRQILAGGIVYPFKKLFKKKKKDWWAIFNQGQRIVSKTMTFYYVTVGCINRFLHCAASIFSCKFFLIDWLWQSVNHKP